MGSVETPVYHGRSQWSVLYICNIYCPAVSCILYSVSTFQFKTDADEVDWRTYERETTDLVIQTRHKRRVSFFGENSVCRDIRGRAGVETLQGYYAVRPSLCGLQLFNSTREVFVYDQLER